jgi:hypothetical protein
VEVARLDWAEQVLHDQFGDVDFIVGSELIYAPHHCTLADVLAQLIPPLESPAPPTTPLHAVLASQSSLSEIDLRRRCVIVQRGDRPGWFQFCERCQALGLRVSVVPCEDLPHVLWESACLAPPRDISPFVFCEISR